MMHWASVTADQFPRLGVDLPPPDEDAADIAILLRWGARGEDSARMWHHPSRADDDRAAELITVAFARIQREIIERGIVERRQIDAMSRQHAALIERGRRELEQIERETAAQRVAWQREHHRQQALVAAGAAQTKGDRAYWLNYAERMKQTTERET